MIPASELQRFLQPRSYKQARTTAFKYLDAYNNPVLTRILKEANQ